MLYLFTAYAHFYDHLAAEAYMDPIPQSNDPRLQQILNYFTDGAYLQTHAEHIKLWHP